MLRTVQSRGGKFLYFDFDGTPPPIKDGYPSPIVFPRQEQEGVLSAQRWGSFIFLSDTVEKIRRIQVERALGSVQSRRASVPARRWVQTAPPMERLKDCHIVLARTPALRPARQGKPQERPPTKLASTILVLETNGRDTTAHSSSPVCRAGAGRITGRNVASLEARLRGTRESASR